MTGAPKHLKPSAGLLKRIRAFRQRLTPRLVWDLLMVYLATINVGLILFDLTYLWLRPLYFRHLPVVTRVYDPVKGIESHPLTTFYLELTDELTAVVAPTSTPQELEQGRAEIEPLLAELRALSLEMLDDNPFERSGQTRSFNAVKAGLGTELRKQGFQPRTAAEGFELLWSWDAERLPARIGAFNSSARRHFEVNYYRAFDLGGQLTDYFWLIDLPFLVIFTIEFYTGWYLAVRRKTYAKWFFYPILNWYDLLGIIPLRHFRLFRLIRIGSIYVRLRRSDLTRVGDDIVTRTGTYIYNIIAEEISDIVAVRILSETAEEVREGRHRQIIRDTVAPHRDALADELTVRTREVLANTAIRRQARGFLDANLERATDSAQALRRLPLPDRLVRPLVTLIGHAVFDSIADTMAATLKSEEGHEALRSILSEAVDGLLDELTDGELEQITRQISLAIIEEITAAVAVRKWAQPAEEAQEEDADEPR